MDSYIVRIYRQVGRQPRILVGTVETMGTRKKIAFTNIEELWEILRHRKSGHLIVPTSLRRRLRKEVISGKTETGLGESSEGVNKP